LQRKGTRSPFGGAGRWKNLLTDWLGPRLCLGSGVFEGGHPGRLANNVKKTGGTDSCSGVKG